MSVTSHGRVIEALTRVGANQNAVKCIAYLDLRGPLSSVQLQKETGLRQPEVSIVIKQLSSEGIVNVKVLSPKGRGRPSHRYQLAIPIQDCLNKYIDAAQQKVDDALSHIEASRQLLSELKR
jgi:predicted transcriptional regulator